MISTVTNVLPFQRAIHPAEASGAQSNESEYPRHCPAIDASECSRPDGKDIRARKARKLSTSEWLCRAVKMKWVQLGRTIKFLGYVISIWWHGKSPERIKKMADEMGGVTLKLLQFITSSPQLAKEVFGEENYREYIDTLSHVTNSNKPMKISELEDCLTKSGIPYSPEQINQRENLGTGSIGEVDRIFTNDGNSLIVKVVAPSTEVRILSDIKIIKTLLSFFSRLRPDAIGDGTKSALCQFMDGINAELDLKNEIENTKKQQDAFQRLKEERELYEITAQDLAPYASKDSQPDTVLLDKIGKAVVFKTVRIQEEYTTQRTMVMDEVKGTTLGVNESSKIRRVLASLIGCQESDINDKSLEAFRLYVKKLAFDQWLDCYQQTGFFNADMHDGNIMVAEENGKLAIYFIDLGNAQHHSKDQVIATKKITGALKALSKTSDDEKRKKHSWAVVECLKHMGDYDPNEAEWVAIDEKIKALIKFGDTGVLSKQVIAVFDLAYQHKVKVPKEIMGLFRAHLLINGNGCPKMNISELLQLCVQAKQKPVMSQSVNGLCEYFQRCGVSRPVNIDTTPLIAVTT